MKFYPFFFNCFLLSAYKELFFVRIIQIVSYINIFSIKINNKIIVLNLYFIFFYILSNLQIKFPFILQIEIFNLQDVLNDLRSNL